MWRDSLIVASFGALGALSRFGVGQFTARYFGSTFPYGTLAVNVVGSFVLGGLAAFLVTQGDMPKALQLGVATGFLGAFTTFSTFSVETVRFIHDGNMNGAAMNVGANLIFGIAAAIVGWWLATVVMA